MNSLIDDINNRVEILANSSVDIILDRILNKKPDVLKLLSEIMWPENEINHSQILLDKFKTIGREHKKNYENYKYISYLNLFIDSLWHYLNNNENLSKSEILIKRDDLFKLITNGLDDYIEKKKKIIQIIKDIDEKNKFVIYKSLNQYFIVWSDLTKYILYESEFQYTRRIRLFRYHEKEIQDILNYKIE